MQLIKTSCNDLKYRILALLLLSLVAGCAGTKAQSSGPNDYVEIPNPALTMSPNAPETIWVPRRYVESGVPRGGELVKRGYEAVTGSGTAATPSVTAQQAGITGLAGKPAAFIPRFGMVVAVDGDKVYFNIGKEAGIIPGQKLKLYRGGTIVEGLGLAKGAFVGTVEVVGYVGSNGSYGLIKPGGEVRLNDLVGVE